MTRLIRPGRTPLDYFGEAEVAPERTQYPARPGRPRPMARPGYTPPVRHDHGSRRQAQYEAVDTRTAIAESMTVGPALTARYERARAEVPTPTRVREMSEQEFWAREARKDAAWRESQRSQASIQRESDAAVRTLQALLGRETPAKTTHVTPQRRVAVYELAREAGLTSAQMLVIVNKQFGEYAKCASSTIATVVADDIRQWLLLPTSTEVLDSVRNGTF